MSSDEVMREGAKRLARESSARAKAWSALDCEARLKRRVEFVVLAVMSALIALAAVLAVGCRSASVDIRESIPLLQERVEAYIEFSAPRPEADEEEREARAALEARIKEQLDDLAARVND